MKPVRTRCGRNARGFSLVEFFIAITISATLLAATMSALDTSYKSYKLTTESASLNMSTRLAMHRLTTLIRNGESFGPFPLNPLVQPELMTNFMEFTTFRDGSGGPVEVWRVEMIPATATEAAAGLGPNKLQAIVTTYASETSFNAGTVDQTFTQDMMYRVNNAQFTLRYDVGPRLRRATVDITVGVREDQADTLYSDLTTPNIRMVSTVRPRRL